MPKSLSTFLDEISKIPGELIRISRPVKPQAFEATAILEHLHRRDDNSVVLFEEPENLFGKPSTKVGYH
jgi:3-polyprenyl-4-hydroxybenzoate decarboxylase